MKIFFGIFTLLLVALAIYPFLMPSEQKEELTGLPWQIEVLPDGTTRVFGIKPGVTHLYDAVALLGSEMELAVIAAGDETGNLEMFYDSYHAGLLSGKLVLQTGTSELDITRWRENAVKAEYAGTGKAKKYTLSRDDVSQALNETISSITFIPAVNLDEEVIIARFGEPEKRLQSGGAQHFLYPDKGLDVALHDDAKEILQYVSPADFQQLIQPLQ